MIDVSKEKAKLEGLPGSYYFTMLSSTPITLQEILKLTTDGAIVQSFRVKQLEDGTYKAHWSTINTKA